ncbi:helix-turn-helix domain-containing protein [Elusimicrobiota bacterium]
MSDEQKDVKAYEIIRKRRVEKGLSLEKVCEDTKIPMKYVKALEDGSYDVFPAKIYLRGFLLSYARYLGIGASAGLWDSVRGLIASAPGDAITRENSDNHAGSDGSQRDDHGLFMRAWGQFALWISERHNWIWAFLVLPAASLGIFFGIYSYVSYRAYNSSPEKSFDFSKLLNYPHKQTTGAINILEARKGFVASNRIVLEVSTKKEPSWLQIEIDGRLSFQGILPAEQKRTLEYSDIAKLKIGNPRSFELKVNDEVWKFSKNDLGKSPLEVHISADMFKE